MAFDPALLTGSQVRAARALLGVSGQWLAERSRLSLSTIGRAEKSEGPVNMIPANLAALVSTLETAGIEFIPSNGGGPGVRLRHPPTPGSPLSRADEAN